MYRIVQSTPCTGLKKRCLYRKPEFILLKECETISETGKALTLWMLLDTAEKSLQTELQGRTAPSSREERQWSPLLSVTWGFLRMPRPAKLQRGRL